jgi:hypothetical protein
LYTVDIQFFDLPTPFLISPKGETMGPAPFEANSFPLGEGWEGGIWGMKRTPVINIEIPTFVGDGLCGKNFNHKGSRRKIKVTQRKKSKPD